jgi:plastocyanin
MNAGSPFVKRLSPTLGLVALATVLAAVLAACSGSSAAPGTASPGQPSRAPASPGTGGGIPTVTAKDLAFAETEVSVPAGAAFELILDNREGAPHNILIRDATGGTLFAGEIVSNGTVTNRIPALAAGTYPFLCEVHPDMTGALVAG